MIHSGFSRYGNIKFENRIYGGSEVTFDRYPYFAYIRSTYVEESKLSVIVCGGALIANRTIMTAAHCIDDSKITEVQVTLDLFDKESDNSFERFDAESWIYHEDYHRNTVRNDIGLIYLKESPKTVLPVNIDFDGRQYSNEVVAIMGFGSTEDEIRPDGLNEILMDVLDSNSCENKFGPILNSTLQFCTSENKSIKVGQKTIQ